MTFPSLNNFNYKQRIAYFSFLFLIAFFCIIYLIINPTIKDIKELRASIIDQKIELENKISKEKNMSQLINKLETIEPQIDTLSSIYINKNRELEFITTLEGIAEQYNIKQSIALNPDDSTKEFNYQKIPLSINAQGSYQNLLRYLTELESMIYYINISTLEILGGNNSSSRGQRESGGGQSLILQISANTYWK